MWIGFFIGACESTAPASIQLYSAAYASDTYDVLEKYKTIEK